MNPDKDCLNWDKTFSAALSKVGNNTLGVGTPMQGVQCDPQSK